MLSGQKEQRPRWKRVLDAENRAMGMILGRIFVKEYFPESAKQRYTDLVEAIRTAYGERIDRLDWMSAATKAKAHEKLAAVTKKVGYPDKWKDYSALVIGRNSYCGKCMNARALALQRRGFEVRQARRPHRVGHDAADLQRLLQPVEQRDRAARGASSRSPASRTRMSTTPSSTATRPPPRSATRSRTASTTKAASSTRTAISPIGGPRTTRTKFQQRADVMVKQFDAYEPLPGLHINGKASLGENIADYGGLLLGLDAFKKTEQYKKGEKIAGFTPMQRYFLGYALGWLSQEREDACCARACSATCTRRRNGACYGPLSNIPEFYEAFGVKQGQPMWRAEADRVQHLVVGSDHP